VLEYRGEAIRGLSMEGRMTICNMSIEAGARAGMIAPDDTTYGYLKDRAHAPQGADWESAVNYWSTLKTDEGAAFDTEIEIDADTLTPFVTWGTTPGQGAPLGDSVPDPASFADPNARSNAERALEYMGLTAGTPLREIAVDTVVRGLLHQRPDRGPARRRRPVIKGRKVAEGVTDAGRARLGPGPARGRGRGPGQGVRGRGRGVAVRRLLDVSGMKPGPAGPRRALRLDLEPQLRGPAGQGRAHPPGLPARRRGHRGHRPPVRPLRPAGGLIRMDKFIRHTGTAVPLRRSNVDTDQSSRRCT